MQTHKYILSLSWNVFIKLQIIILQEERQKFAGRIGLILFIGAYSAFVIYVLLSVWLLWGTTESPSVV